MAALTVLFQVLSLVASVAILVVIVALARRWPDSRLITILPGLWAAGGVIYYGLLLAGRFSPQALLLWGAVHRFLAVVMFLGGFAILYGLLAVEEAERLAGPPHDDGDDGTE